MARAENRAPRTIADYEYHLGQFRRWLKDDPKLEDITRGTVRSHLAYLTGERHNQPVTVNQRLKYLRVFFNFLVAEGLLPASPVHGVKSQREPERTRSLTEEEVKAILEVPDRRTFTGLRNYTMLLVILDTGIRVGELLNLNLPDITGAEIAVRSEVSKTRRQRALPLSQKTYQALQRYLRFRPRQWEGRLFCNSEGKPLTRNAFGRQVRNYGKKAGIEPSRATPYAFRHTFALFYLRNGGDPFSLQRIMGHRDIEMTKRYLGLTQEDLASRHAKASPVERLLEKRLRKIGRRGE